jgi:hypothetical protein
MKQMCVYEIRVTAPWYVRGKLACHARSFVKVSAMTATTAIRLVQESVAKKNHCRPSEVETLLLALHHTSAKIETERVINHIL